MELKYIRRENIYLSCVQITLARILKNNLKIQL